MIEQHDRQKNEPSVADSQNDGLTNINVNAAVSTSGSKTSFNYMLKLQMRLSEASMKHLVYVFVP